MSADFRKFGSSSSRGETPIQSNVKLSKCLSWLLRHGAKNEGLTVGADGFVDIDDILKHKSFRGCTEDALKQVVESNDKQRFTLRVCSETEKLQIRANQGHSFLVNDLDLKAITKAPEAPIVVHGTTLKNWQNIQNEGLSRMNRIHIHFAAGEPGSKEIISGMRFSSEVLIYIDLEKALADGISFYRSSNNVILSQGDERGFIGPKYFKTVKILK